MSSRSRRGKSKQVAHDDNDKEIIVNQRNFKVWRETQRPKKHHYINKYHQAAGINQATQWKKKDALIQPAFLIPCQFFAVYDLFFVQGATFCGSERGHLESVASSSHHLAIAISPQVNTILIVCPTSRSSPASFPWAGPFKATNRLLLNFRGSPNGGDSRLNCITW